MDFETTDPNISVMTNTNSNFTTQQHMFGPRLLVTPVTLPNVTEWPVYLPQVASSASSSSSCVGKGFNCTESKPWTYWWTNVTYAGGQTVVVPAPINHIPLFHLGSRADIFSGNVF